MTADVVNAGEWLPPKRETAGQRSRGVATPKAGDRWVAFRIAVAHKAGDRWAAHKAADRWSKLEEAAGTGYFFSKTKMFDVTVRCPNAERNRSGDNVLHHGHLSTSETHARLYLSMGCGTVAVLVMCSSGQRRTPQHNNIGSIHDAPSQRKHDYVGIRVPCLVTVCDAQHAPTILGCGCRRPYAANDPDGIVRSACDTLNNASVLVARSDEVTHKHRTLICDVDRGASFGAGLKQCRRMSADWQCFPYQSGTSMNEAFFALECNKFAHHGSLELLHVLYMPAERLDSPVEAFNTECIVYAALGEVLKNDMEIPVSLATKKIHAMHPLCIVHIPSVR